MRWILAALFVCTHCGGASAVDFHSIVNATSSTSDTDLWPVSNLIQGPGVGFDAAAPYEKTSTDAEGNWVTADPGGFPSDYIAEAGSPLLTFDLGGDVALNAISLWNYADNANGVSEFSLSFATDAEGPGGGSVTAGPFETAGDLATGFYDFTSRQNFLFDQVIARYVELTVIDNYFVEPGDGSVEGTDAGGDRVGLGEVAFPVVPEPSSLVLAAFVLGGAALRRYWL